MLSKGGVFLSVSSEDPLQRKHLFLIILKYKIPGALSPGVKLRYNLNCKRVRLLIAASRGWIPGRGKTYLFFTTSRPVLGCTPPPIQ
jgi:hypothetical protein